MKLIITGGCGFLGSNLAQEAIARGCDTMVFDNLSRAGASANLEWLRSLGTVEFRHGDIRNANDVERAIRDFEPGAVFHLAGQVAMTTSIRDPRLDFEINTVGSHNLLEALRQHAPGAALLYSSTNKVYGDLDQYRYDETPSRYVCTDHPDGFDETTPLDFRSPYGCSKGAVDQYMLDYARIFDLKTVVFRHSSMYGGRQFATYDQGWVGWFCQKALESRRDAGSMFTISGTGKQVRDLLHADDMKRLYFAALDRIDVVAGQAFNIGGGSTNSLSLLELFAMLEEIGGAKLGYEQLPARSSDQRVFIADISKARRLLTWEPLVTAREGVERMLDWSANLVSRPNGIETSR